MKTSKLKCLATVAFISLILSACGGGSSGSSSQPPVQTYTIGGTISGLSTGNNTILNNSGGNSLTVTSSGTFTFTNPVASNGSYAVTIATQPTGQVCTVSNGSGTGVVANVNNIGIICTAVPPLIDEQPLPVTVSFGGSASFSVHATGFEPLTYQWFRAGIAITGATSNSLNVNPVSFAEDGVSYSVTVSNVAGVMSSQPAKIMVTPASGSIPVNGCQDISTPGSYMLTGDIGSSAVTTTCIAIHDTSAVQLNCGGHRITASTTTYSGSISITNMQNFSVKNCVISNWSTQVSSSSNGTFSANSFFNPDQLSYFVFNVDDSDHFVFDGNNVSGSFQEQYGNSNSISNNQMTVSSTLTSVAVIVTAFSSHTRVLNNMLDGSWTGLISTGFLGTRMGADDGIVAEDSDDLRIEKNQIQNVWDTGIESTGTITMSTFRGNHILRAQYAGIGGWYYSSLLGNMIANNTIEKSGNFFEYLRIDGLRPAGTDYEKKLPADTAIYFKDNVFDGNIFLDPIWFSGPSYAGQIPVFDNLQYALNPLSGQPGEVAATSSDIKIGNNVFKNNQFGTQGYSPFFGNNPPVPGMIIDGGGNSCPPILGPAVPNYPIKCN